MFVEADNCCSYLTWEIFFSSRGRNSFFFFFFWMKIVKLRFWVEKLWSLWNWRGIFCEMREYVWKWDKIHCNRMMISFEAKTMGNFYEIDTETDTKNDTKLKIKKNDPMRILRKWSDFNNFQQLEMNWFRFDFFVIYFVFFLWRNWNVQRLLLLIRIYHRWYITRWP